MPLNKPNQTTNLIPELGFVEITSVYVLKCNSSSHELNTPGADNVCVKNVKIPLLTMRMTMIQG